MGQQIKAARFVIFWRQKTKGFMSSTRAIEAQRKRERLVFSASGRSRPNIFCFLTRTTAWKKMRCKSCMIMPSKINWIAFAPIWRKCGAELLCRLGTRRRVFIAHRFMRTMRSWSGCILAVLALATIRLRWSRSFTEGS